MNFRLIAASARVCYLEIILVLLAPPSDYQMNYDSQTKSETTFSIILENICELFNDCWECMADYFIRAGKYVVDFWNQAVDWCDDRLNCCCRDDENRIDVRYREKQVRYISNKQAATIKTLVAPEARLATTKSASMSDHRTMKSKVDKPEATSNLAPPESGPPSEQNLPVVKTLPSTQPPPAKAAASQPSTGSTMKVPNGLPVRATNQSSVTFTEPPKIDFIETGSIFGDRKKQGTDHNMLRLDNGRFRSPGLSQTIAGPNGRTIRVSFVTGFPPLKSIDSGKSHTSIATRRSKSSLGSVQPVLLAAMKKSTETPAIKNGLESPPSRKNLPKSSGSLEINDMNSKSVEN